MRNMFLAVAMFGALLSDAHAQTVTPAQQAWLDSVKSPMSNYLRVKGEANDDKCAAPNRTRWDLPDGDVRDVPFFPGDVEFKAHNGGWYRVPSQSVIVSGANPFPTAQVWYEVMGDPRRALYKVVCFIAKP